MTILKQGPSTGHLGGPSPGPPGRPFGAQPWVSAGPQPWAPGAQGGVALGPRVAKLIRKVLIQMKKRCFGENLCILATTGTV